jgi:hypothetical protein
MKANKKVKDQQEKYPKESPKENKSEDTSDTPDLSVLEGWYQFTKDVWRTKRWDFFVIDQFVKGNHNVSVDPSDNTIYINSSTDYVSYPINKVFANFRAARGFVTRHKPKVEVVPTEFDDNSKTYARRANAVLGRDNRLNNFRKLNKEWAYYGIKYGIGYRQVGYDKVNKVSVRWSVDPFDLGIGATTGKFEDAPFIIKDVKRTVAYWKNKFPNSNIVPDNKGAGDEFKELSEQIDNPAQAKNQMRADEQTAIGHEVWYRTYKPNKLGGYINKCLFTSSELLSFEETPYKEYPFIAYESDVNPNRPYPEGHLKHQISPQRLYNLLNMHMLEYNYLVNRGRFQYPKGSGFEVIKAKEGQMIRHNPGKKIEVVAPPPINPSLQWQIGKADEDMNLIGAYNDASYGKLPTANASGDLVEALQSGDSNNLLELRENFEDALSQEATLILNMYSLFEKDGFMVEDKVKEDQIDKFMVMGDKAAPQIKGDKYYSDDNGGYVDYVKITEDNNVKVSVTSELGETKAARLNILMKLAEAGIIPGKVILEHLEFPDSDDILQRIAEESVAEMAQEIMKQPSTPPPVQNIPPVK